MLKQYRKNAINFIGNYTWNEIYKKAFTSLFKG
jgi:hypothetical protein